MKIVTKQANCIGSGQCVFTDPDTFDQDDDGKVTVLKDHVVGATQIALAREAAQVCPSRSILLTEEAGDE